MPAYSLSRDADEDLREIWKYTAERWGPDQAEIYLRQLHDRFEIFLARPARSISGLSQPVRFIRFESHVICFVEQNHAPLIIAILHERMDLLARLKDRL